MLCFDRHISLFDDELVVDSLSPHTDSGRIPTPSEPCLPPEMQSERARLQSFATWPANGARKLASYGFYASRENDYITCAFCGLEISGFSSWREVKTWHWEVSGKDCPLLKEQGEETVPKIMYSSSKERVGSVNTNYRIEHLQLLKSTFPDCRENCSGMSASASSVKAAEYARLMKDSGEVSQQLAGSLAASEPRVEEPDREKLGSHQDLARSVVSSFTTFTGPPPKFASAISTPRNVTRSKVNVCSSTRSASTSSTTLISIPPPSTPSSSSSSSSPPPQRASSSSSSAAAAGSGGVMPWRELVRTARVPHMVAYQARLGSLSSWPLLSPTPRDLARAGLFRDTSSSSSSSSSSSPPLPSRACPSSSSLSSLSPPQPSRSCPSTSSSTSSPPVQSRACQSPSSSSSHPPPSAVRSALTEPSSPASIFQSCSNPKEKEEDSSRQAASSRSSGGDSRTPGRPQDSVQCFWCGVHMHRWQPSDDPVLEHARLSPDCRYVMQLLGHQLHRDVIAAVAVDVGSVARTCSRKGR